MKACSGARSEAKQVSEKKPMNKIIKLLILCVWALACGAPEEDQAFDPDSVFTHDGYPVDGDIGTLGQPIYAQSSYGVDASNFKKCPLTTAGGSATCAAPSKKRFYAIVDSGAQCGTIDGVDFAAQIVAAVLELAPKINSDARQVKLSTSDFAGANIITIDCNGAATPGTTGWSTTPPPTGSYNCSTVGGGGHWCKFAAPHTYMSVTAIRAATNWATNNASQRGRFLRNLVKHELMHSFGTGHNTFSDTTQLMNTAASQNVNTYWWDTVMQPTAAEIEVLRSYNPDGTTPL